GRKKIRLEHVYWLVRQTASLRPFPPREERETARLSLRASSLTVLLCRSPNVVAECCYLCFLSLPRKRRCFVFSLSPIHGTAVASIDRSIRTSTRRRPQRADRIDLCAVLSWRRSWRANRAHLLAAIGFIRRGD
ncbi:unnamed protein product, partial [Phaeothamnion confervicola]